ncbi:hypothetical protein BDV30DRAFT_125167 [Aspergillus minisclerotigenes]|uniref:Uncharacterized protein n=1 Tax=Aspergillus minisclerotigenes TaxID=656917 RepID=A0A5N6JIM0_9EURO|nr:hypothetical protein BDV30DRAFT_125167 [Aspergillus minisclerotigenes]
MKVSTMCVLPIVTTWASPGNEEDRADQNLSDLIPGGRCRVPVNIMRRERPGGHSERYQGCFRRGAAQHEIVKSEKKSSSSAQVLFVAHRSQEIYGSHRGKPGANEWVLEASRLHRRFL